MQFGVVSILFAFVLAAVEVLPCLLFFVAFCTFVTYVEGVVVFTVWNELG